MRVEETTAGPTARNLRIAVIGAGVSGIGMAIRLQRAGIDFTLFEKAETVGGTWRDNRYPGLTCDVPGFVYTYSFARKPRWPTLFAPGAELQSYLVEVFERFGLGKHARFGSEVVEARWRDDHWQLRVGTGDEDRAAGATTGAGTPQHWEDFDAVVHACGFLHHPRIPDIPGLERFAGPAFHSARWPDGIELDGKRVGIVGTGSTGAQLVTALAGRAAHVALFQRTLSGSSQCRTSASPSGWAGLSSAFPAQGRASSKSSSAWRTSSSAPPRSAPAGSAGSSAG
jgi:cation diffusion facilitator CzcD-associated flavoprotein CzcO